MKFTHQLSFRNINLEVDSYTEGNWFIHGYQISQGESVAKPETLLLIILILVCKLFKL